MTTRLDHSIGDALFDRAQRVIPGGIYGHQTPAFLVAGAFPKFLSAAHGCRVVDPDGHQYIDFMCAYGPMVLGYGDPVVEAAAERQRRLCDVGTLPAPVMVELAEKLVDITTGMDWAMFAKNGSDGCTWSIAVAREATGRDMVAMVGGSYHGVHGWCNAFQRGFPDGERATVLTFSWNDAASLERLFAAHHGKIAAVMITPFRHEGMHDSELPTREFLDSVRRQCTSNGAVMIVDDVRAGFRINIGGSLQHWGVTPDMTVYSKAVANGYPLAVLLGADSLRTPAQGVFYTGTFATQAVPLAASLATIEQLIVRDAIVHMDRVGRRLCNGLAQRASAAGLAVTLSGPPSIPFMTFVADDGGFDRSRTFSAECAGRGAFFHPHHNWFVSMAHSDADIDAALAIAEVGFAQVLAEHGADQA
ncbi:MAG: aminotransferase class III-fold pyridoxal phosphate-dependent enzyme [Deltaproteobacteria bacterium]|nr:aminotransferase class III-fold pyridoxal phosphate-dependent enzyme [Deltaproteobacteria bacterium]